MEANDLKAQDLKERVKREYGRWLELAAADPDLIPELKAMEDDGEKRFDCFYRSLEFGTAGLRGVIGAGSNRMNVYTVAATSQGLADYINALPDKGCGAAHGGAEGVEDANGADGAKKSIAISYDSRIKSELFAKTAAGVFAANGIKVHIYRQIMPVPCLSFAVRELGCDGGIMITASHNPSKYNGYKVYGSDGCQITSEAARAILERVSAVDPFADVKSLEFEKCLVAGLVSYISDEVETAFAERVKGQSRLTAGDEISKDVAIVYTPLNGSGLRPILRVLKETGYTNIQVVKEQEAPDGNFPTCPYPNPEIKEAMAMGMEYAKRCSADLLLATDPDCDRVGIAVKNAAGDFKLLTGNETGMLLLDYICAKRRAAGQLPPDAVAIKTIVTTDMAERIAKSYGVAIKNVLTGFKYIGEQIALLEAKGREEAYIFGFEESYGYLSGTYVRDKDGVVASFLICEMFAYYKSKGLSLLERLEQLYEEHGYALNTLYSYAFEGAKGAEQMAAILEKFNGGVASFGAHRVAETIDYNKGVDGLPKENVLKYVLEDGCTVIIRPSGTEPKLKAYLSVSAPCEEDARNLEKSIAMAVEDFVKG